jgi:hypothetical protein
MRTQDTRAAAVGSAVHGCCADMAKRDAWDLDAGMSAAGVSPDDAEQCARLMSSASRQWRALKVLFPVEVIRTERSMTHAMDLARQKLSLSGTIDLLAPHRGSACMFLDWKTGWEQRGISEQQLGYAYLVWQKMDRPDDTEITGIVAWLAHGKYQVTKYDAASLKLWESRLENQLKQRATYTPGDQCIRCDCAPYCEARRDYARSCIEPFMFGESKQGWYEAATALLVGVDENSKTQREVQEAAATLAHRIRLVEKAAEQARVFLREAVTRAGGEIDLPGDTVLRMNRQQRRALNPHKALPVLRNHLSDAQICACMRLSLPQAVQKYAAMHRRKSETSAYLTDQLAAAGAIETSLSFRLEEVSRGDTKDQVLE